MTVTDGIESYMGIVASAAEWAALVLEHEFEGFSRGDRGIAAERLYGQIRERLGVFPDWRGLWGKSSS